MVITKEFLMSNPNCIFVFGDNLERMGKGGAAALRDEPNTYGFITKKYPSNRDDSFYTLEEYKLVYPVEIKKLVDEIHYNPHKIYFISKLGAGLANKHGIWDKIIKPNLIFLNTGNGFLRAKHNVVFLFNIEGKETGIF